MENTQEVLNENIENNSVKTEGQDVNQEKETENKDVKSFTQEELDKIIKSNVDRALAKATKEAEEKQEEAKRLAKMNADEKAKYELEKKEADFARREAELNKRELTATAKDILAEKGLPHNLHTILNYESADTVNESIKVVEKAIQKAVEKAVEDRLKGNAPKKSIGTSEGINYFERGAKVN
ncbi:DUF4355 domain-containing protein [Helcococcus sueciensis]|uniref:DUF4355 domain-containing protein n=1 Tax=Helcococcus sueciensis TaxID=241555 RepID=UPI0004229BC3|nr:DUF4355 domain-containing protein [Helcococcus sueciensis]